MQFPLSDADLSRSLQASPFYQQSVELSPLSQRKRHRWLRQAMSALVDYLTGRSQLSIRAKTLPNGQQQWIVYDPDQDIRRTFDSQQAVRAWLEQRYY